MNCKGPNAKLYLRFISAVLIPIVLLPVVLLNESLVSTWFYVVLVMIVYWVTEAVPHAITSLIPIGLFPLLGIKGTAEICKLYVHETIFTLLGSLIISYSVEECNLHKRLALKILCHVQCFHRRLHFILMAVTMFISMWMQNLSVVVMMSPISLSILEQLEAQGTTKLFEPKVIEDADEVSRPTRVTMCYLLGITYAATLGGCGSLLGTPTNLAFKGIFEIYMEREIDFLRFFLYCAPIMLLNTLLTWLWLQFLFMGLLRPKSEDAIAISVTEESAQAVKENIILNYKAMGRLSGAEMQVAVLLVAYQLVLAFRSPYFMQGWDVISKSKIGDASPTIIFVIILFIIPSEWSCFKCCRTDSDDKSQVQSRSLLTWTFVRRRLPWGLIFLLGAGIAISVTGKELKIHDKIGELTGEEIPAFLLISFIVCLVCQIFTEFLSNAAAASIILPFLAAFCFKFRMDPLDLMFPAALSLNMAFHSLIGTPGNAYVAGLINIPVKQMVYCGFCPSIITLFTYWSTFPTYGRYIYKELYNVTDSVNADVNRI